MNVVNIDVDDDQSDSSSSFDFPGAFNPSTAADVPSAGILLYGFNGINIDIDSNARVLNHLSNVTIINSNQPLCQWRNHHWDWGDRSPNF